MVSRYPRALLKLSGEALQGDQTSGIDPGTLARFAGDIADLADMGVERALVIGGGNLFRGAALAARGLDRVTGDHMGMLATVMNALAMQDALRQLGTDARVLSAISVGGVCETFSRAGAISHLAARRVVIFAAGTGNPFFTTDTAASLRAIEIGADIMIKATRVDGVYSDDPLKNPSAERFSVLSYDEALDRRLGVMDQTAMVLCRDNRMSMRVLDANRRGALRRALLGEDEGTLVNVEGAN